MRNFSTKTLLGILLTAMLLIGGTLRAQISLTATAGTPTGTYTDLTSAFAAINAGTHQGLITVNVTASYLEPGTAVLNSSGAGSASYTSIVVQPSVDGVIITGATAGGRGLIELKGADNVTINGDNPNTGGTNRNLTIANTALSTTTYNSVIRVANAATVVTSSDNVAIRNLILVGSATGRNASGFTSTTGSENTTFGIYVGGNGGSTATDAPTAVTSVTTTSAPTGTTVNGLVIDNNIIGAVARAVVYNGAGTSVSTGVTVTNNIIGNTGTLSGIPPYNTPSTTVYTKGIWLAGTDALTVTGNTIQNILSYVGTTMNAIELNSNIGTGTVTISNNNIVGVVNNGSSAAFGIQMSNCAANFVMSGNMINNVQTFSASTAGIVLNYTGTSAIFENNNISNVVSRSTSGLTSAGLSIASGNNITVRNNFIFDINGFCNNSSLSTTYNIWGIRIVGGTGHKLYHNSVNLFGPVVGASSFASIAALGIASTGSTGMDIRNNIFACSMTGMPASSAVSCIQFPTNTLTSAFDLRLNNNAYYQGSGTGAAIGQAGVTSGTGIYLASNFNAGATTPAANMRSYTSTLSVAGTNDNASYASGATPPFTSNTNLHLDLGSPEISNIESKGDASVGVATDYDGNARPNLGNTIPDIGGDEVLVANCATAVGGTITPSTATKCQNETHSMTAVGATTGTGISYQWQVSTTSGGPYTNVIGGSGANTTSYTTGPLAAGTFYYVLQVTCSFGPVTALSNQVTVTVNPAPTIAVTPAAASICIPGGTPITLTATGGLAYTWAPATGLTPITGSPVVANPGATTTYTVTGVDILGCTNTATAVISVSEVPSVISVTATPPSVCSGANSQLLGTAATTTSYTVTSIPYALVPTPGTGVTTLSSAGAPIVPLSAGSLDDGGWIAQTIPFNFNFYGASYSQFAVSTNGFIVPGGGTPNTFTGYGNAFPSAFAATPSIGALYSDLDFRTIGTIEYFTVGAAPNRKLVINWKNGNFYNGVGALNTQMILYETSNMIEVHTTNSTGNNVAVEGIQNPTGTATAYTAPGRNAVTWPVTVPDGYRWTPSGGPVTYSWSPATFLSATNINNPVATAVTATTTYTMTASVSGCTNTGTVTVTAGAALTSSANATPSNSICANTNVTLNAVPAGGGAPYTYSWTGPSSFTSNLASPVITGITPAQAGIYSVTITDNCLATSVATVTLTVNGAPTIAVTPTTGIICNPGGSPVTLTATGGLTYTWAPTAGLTPTSGAVVAANPTGSTVYTVTGTDVNGCTNTATASISVGSVVTATATAAPASICPNGSSVLTAVGATPNIPYCQPVYSSGTGFGDFCTLVQLGTINNASVGAPTPFYTNYPVSPTTTTTLTAGSTYTITLTPGTYTSNDFASWIDYNQNGILNDGGEKLGETDNMAAAPATTSFTFTVPVGAYNGTTRLRVREADQGTTQGMDPCTGYSFGETEDYTITIVGGVDPMTYSWTPATFLGATNTASVNATAVTATTTYIATATSGSGCSDTASVTLSVATTATAAPSASVPLCEGVGNTLSANATGGQPLSYVWSPGGGTTATIAGDNTVGAHTYTVSVTDACGNTALGTLNYTVNPNPVDTISPDTSAICGGSAPINLAVTGTNTVVWSPAAGLSSTTGNAVIANPTASTTYTAISTDLNGCQDTLMAFVGVGPAVTISGFANPNGVCSGDSTQLIVTGGLPVGSYCQPVYTNGTQFGDYCSNVQLGTINNPTLGAAGPAYYTLFPMAGATTTTLTAGSTYTITVGVGTYTNNDIASFIDYDQNGVLNDAGEKLGETDNMVANATTSWTFTVPASAYNGVTRLRVREMDHGGTNDIDPCTAQSTFGETEDYDITIVGGIDRISFGWDPSPQLSNLTNDTVWATNITGTTTFIATSTSGIGCSDTAAVTVMLSTTPPTAVCSSLPFNLALDSAGLAIVNPAAVDSGSSDACGIATLTMTQDTFTCAMVGSHVSTLIVTNVNGVSDSCSVNVSIVDNLAPSIICPSDTTVMSNICTGGASVFWNAPTVWENCTPIISSSDQPGDTLPIGNTTIVYTVADSAGQQDTCSFIVTVTFNTMNVGPSANPSTVCVGDPTTINANVVGGVAPLTFNWSNGGGTTNPTTVSPSTTTTYAVTVTDACGVQAFGSTTVTVSPNPVANFTFIDNQNGQVTFTNTTTNGTSYSWNFGNTQTGTQSGSPFTFNYGTAGTFTVTMIATNSCGSDTVVHTVDVTTGIRSSMGDLNSSVFPNPNRGEFNLVLNNMAGEHVSVSITDMRGVEIKHLEMDVDAATHRESLDISAYAKGVYFVRVSTEGRMKVHKVTVQ
jgi:hypothetical protein